MHWTFLAAFSPKPGDPPPKDWLDRLVPEDRHEFQHVTWRGAPSPGWHSMRSPRTSRRQWADFWHHTQSAWKLKKGGLITNFPQLSTTVGLKKRISRDD